MKNNCQDTQDSCCVSVTGDSQDNLLPLPRVIFILVCCLMTFFLLQSVRGTRNVEILKDLNTFPRQVGPWKMVHSITSDEAVVSMLGVDDYLNYTYEDTSGNIVDLYVGYYGSVGNGKGYHSPKNCLPGGGWGIDRVREVVIYPGGKKGRSARIAEMIIRRGNEYQVVFYWFQNRGRIIASEYWEKIYLVLDALLKKRRDGAFVRIMAQVKDGDIKETEEKIIKFSALVLNELDDFLPGKKLAGDTI